MWSKATTSRTRRLRRPVHETTKDGSKESKESKEPKESKDGEKKDADAMETDQPNGTAEPKPKMRKIKKQVRKGDLPLSSGTAGLDEGTKAAAAERENAMFMEDKLVADTEEKKNELEAFIYELRGKIDDQYAEFSNEEEKEKVREKCTQTEVSQTKFHRLVAFSSRV